MGSIFILTEGGENIGMGHISRCLSLYQAFQEKGYKSQLIINGDKSIESLIKATNYLRLNWISSKSEILSIVDNADIIIIDSYNCPLEIYNSLSGVCKIAAYIDDNVRLEYPKGVVINGVIGSEELDYSKRDDIIYLLGEQYSFLRNDFWDVPQKIIAKDVNSIMVTCGGNDLNGLSLRILKQLVKDYPSVKKNFILKNINLKGLAYFEKHASIYIGINASQMKDLMIKSDIAISAAGQTTYELCRVGTPFVAINTATNQTFSINNFYKRGLVNPAILPNDQEFELKLSKQLCTLTSFGFRKRLSQKMQLTITGKGSISIVEYLINKI
jgi:UDP-2,4-diacetamido-2,4,6-trideoxy-beta-L-altropyranose hydrolase